MQGLPKEWTGHNLQVHSRSLRSNIRPCHCSPTMLKMRLGLASALVSLSSLSAQQPALNLFVTRASFLLESSGFAKQTWKDGPSICPQILAPDLTKTYWTNSRILWITWTRSPRSNLKAMQTKDRFVFFGKVWKEQNNSKMNFSEDIQAPTRSMTTNTNAPKEMAKNAVANSQIISTARAAL